MAEKKVDDKTQESTPSQDDPATLEAALGTIKKLKDSTVSKEEYATLLASNKKLIDSIAEGTAKPTEQPTTEVTPAIMAKRCADRNENMKRANGLEKVQMLIANFDDMKAMGLNVSNVDSTTVEALRDIVKESGGSYRKFKELCGTFIMPSID